MKIRRYSEMENRVLQAAEGCILAVTGPDLYQSSRLQRLMVRKFRNEFEYEILRIKGDELPAGCLRRHLLENSLFTSGKLIVISKVHSMGKAAQSELMNSIEDGPGDCALFLKSEKVPRESAILRKLEKRIPLFICYEPFDREMSSWASKLASEESIKLSRETVQLLTEYSGKNLRRMSGAIEKLALYHGAGASVGREGMLEVLSGKNKADIFDLGDMIFGNHRGKALEVAWSLLRNGEEPIGLISYIFSQWQKVVGVIETIAAGGGKNEVAAATGAKYPLLDKLMKFSKSTHKLDPAVASEAFSEADIGIKTGVDHLIVFARLIFTLTSGHP